MKDRHPDDELDDHVAGIVGRIQADYLSDDRTRFAKSSALLARLRRAVGREPGDDPAVWAPIFGGWPASLPVYGDAPTPAERAAFTAVTLYAVHQQSKRRDGMHKSGRSLGWAVGELSRRSGTGDNVRRRFDMIATAQSIDEIVYHARGLVTQLRGADPGIPLDYGLLASHLRKLQYPASATTVRLRWGRDYYQTGRTPAKVDSTAIPLEIQETAS
ncbi:type I-E CRISPR-associated protein Cse2/CasB [Nakamurella multipartita]|uniref:CRISPR-associated protein, Cse2 family n=1 Tax=Nakamurella multipartita (strain ATCC 700099 / DSM 44233 / CIP 104796 / JCM 9543 / NBRC 105858 / Y-104) TaxID=479431 RepID=C8XAY6_NAKMY|nr:type I-E CRISPR-associated protein Cse2/CasB [Nakamurella multipartita]ACV79389.1 CRISPR-associated protein, Cse2 family [Nakamurella multipartita DSM 44233]